MSEHAPPDAPGHVAQNLQDEAVDTAFSGGVPPQPEPLDLYIDMQPVTLEDYARKKYNHLYKYHVGIGQKAPFLLSVKNVCNRRVKGKIVMRKRESGEILKGFIGFGGLAPGDTLECLVLLGLTGPDPVEITVVDVEDYEKWKRRVKQDNQVSRN